MKRRIDRRTLLRGAAGISLALPFLDAMVPARARAQEVTPPLRFGVFFSANGVREDDWVPSGGELDFELSTALAPRRLRASSKQALAMPFTMPLQFLWLVPS